MLFRSRKYTNADPAGTGTKPPDYTGTEIFVCPGTSARNWENDAYSPRTKMLYTHTDNSCRSMVAITGEYKPGEGYNLTRQAGGVTVPMKDINGQNTNVPTDLKAFDVVGRKIAWSKPNNDTSRTPQMVTATDILFKGNNATGNFEAYDAKNGNTVWSFRAGSRFNQSPITYSYQGKQYVAII